MSRVACKLGGVRDHLESTRRSFALTFDDGPDPAFTPRIMNELEALDATATFFLVGSRVERHPELVREIVARGHEVGSHSQSHSKPWETSAARLDHDYRLGRASLEHVLERRVRLFRPPTARSRSQRLRGSGSHASMRGVGRSTLATGSPRPQPKRSSTSRTGCRQET